MDINPVSIPIRGISVSMNKVEDGLEKAFLAEMMKYAGPKPLSGEFGGGIGEDQFASMMTDIHATAIADRIDMGLIHAEGGQA